MLSNKHHKTDQEYYGDETVYQPQVKFCLIRW